MDKEGYNEVLEKLAKKRNVSKEEVEQGLQEVLDDIFACMDDAGKEKWRKLVGSESKITARAFVECMADFFQSLERKC